jgi:ABC-type transport system involved in cytochrome c biogenesis ATPase subunit
MRVRLREFRVEKLFGLYSHRITFNLNERITIIVGPNGRGKTVCLKFIEALFTAKFDYFSEIPFESATFAFMGGEVIHLENADEIGAFSMKDGPQARSIRLTLKIPGQEANSWTPLAVDRDTEREIRRYLGPTWRQIGYDLWLDESDGEETTTTDIIARYRIPPKLAASLRQDMPDDLSRIIKEIDCHLIETQRLLVLPADREVNRELRIYAGRPQSRSRVSRLAIQQKAEKLKSILGETLARYANRSQSLDRTFPLRVLEAQGTAKLSEDELRAALKEMEERRAALMASGILDTDYRPVSLRAGGIEPGVAKALEIYVEDTISKLDVFNEIHPRIDLFRELINKLFLDKALHIDRESGFRITSSNGSGVPLDKLSSGEQHQLILIFDLLFEVTANSLILIDEPELSLHVAWQRRFIESLSKIISLNAFDVILATHSPAIVARHFDLAVELAPVDA